MKISESMKAGLVQAGQAGRGVPDRVPVMAQINEHARKLSGCSPREYYTDAGLFFKHQLAVSEYYRIDFPASEYYDMYNIELEALGQPLRWFEDMPPEVDHTRRIIGKPQDIDRLSPPDPKKSGRMPFVLELKKRALDSGFRPGVRFCSPISLAVNLCGMENLIMGLMTNQAAYHRLFTFLTDEVLSPWIYEQRRLLGQDLEAMGADAYASPPNMNLEILREFGLAYIKRLRDNIGKVSARGWWGERFFAGDRDKLKEFMDLKMQLSPSYYGAFDPDPQVLGVDMFRRFTEERNVALMVGIDAVLLFEGPVEAIANRVRDYIRAGAHDGRFTLFLNEVPKDAPPAHVHAAVQAARYYGLYPHLDEVPGGRPFVPEERESYADFAAGYFG